MDVADLLKTKQDAEDQLASVLEQFTADTGFAVEFVSLTEREDSGKDESYCVRMILDF